MINKKLEVLLIKLTANVDTYKVVCIKEDYHPTWWSHLDESNVREVAWNIEKNDLILDVGAAYGSYSLDGLAKGAKKIYAWAPEAGLGDAPENEILYKNLEINNWQDKGVIYDYGFYDKEGWLDTFTQDYYFTYPYHIEDTKNLIKVQTLDKWYEEVFLTEDDRKNYNNVWMKLDVEGAELNVLKTAEKLLKELSPILSIENHIFKDANIENKIHEYLTNIGYTKIFREAYNPTEIQCKLKMVDKMTFGHNNISHSIYAKLK